MVYTEWGETLDNLPMECDSQDELSKFEYIEVMAHEEHSKISKAAAAKRTKKEKESAF